MELYLILLLLLLVQCQSYQLQKHCSCVLTKAYSIYQRNCLLSCPQLRTRQSYHFRLPARRGVLEFDPVTGTLIESTPDLNNNRETSKKSRKSTKEKEELEASQERPVEDFIDESYDDEEEDEFDLSETTSKSRKVRFAEALGKHPKFITSVQENRRTLAYPSQRVALMMLFRRIVRAVQNGFILHATNTTNPVVSNALSRRTRIKMAAVVELLKNHHEFREEVMTFLQLPKSLKLPHGLDDQLFIGEVDFDITKDILLQNVYLPSSVRADIKEFFLTIGDKVVDMTVEYYDED